jgi:hypothetical protein
LIQGTKPFATISANGFIRLTLFTLMILPNVEATNKIAHILDLVFSEPTSHGQKTELRSQMFGQTDETGTSSTIFVAL